MIKIVECPRDAMQGWPHLISTESKIKYLNQLLKVGFDTIDFGSFVSPKAIPQMADTKDVIGGLDLSNTKSKLLAIIANTRGANDAVSYDEINYLGFPFSISPTFQKRNANSSIDEALNIVEEIQNLCVNNNKELVVYISMGFGNPYGDEYHADLVAEWTYKIANLGVKIISVADTVGLASPELIYSVMKEVMASFKNIEVGVHLHSAPHNRIEKLDAALKAGVKRFDSAILGIGGCPMAGDSLIGNMDTSLSVDHFTKLGNELNLNMPQLKVAEIMASTIFI
ncbi:MAG: hydroxymethylglutaryl-CoA lyase [Ferruginibacter sp.]